MESLRRQPGSTPTPAPKTGAGPGWKELLKGAFALHLARSAQRVLDRQRSTGTAAATTAAATTAASRTVAADPATAVVADPQQETVENSETPPVPRDALGISKLVFQEFGRDNGTMMAAAVAFYLLLSIIPLVLVGASILGFFIREPERVVDQVFTFLNQFLPIGKRTIRPIIDGLIRERGSLSLVGLVGVALTATGGFATLENAINVLWNRPNRNFIMNKIYAFMMMLVVGVLFMATLGFTTMLALAGRVPGLEWLAGSWLEPVIGIVVPLGISTVMFAVVYRFYPNGRTHWGSSFVSGAITAGLWEAFKVGYAFYASRDSSPYGVVVGLVMWIFYSSALVLLGSELTWVLEGCPGREGKEAIHEQRSRDRKPGDP